MDGYKTICFPLFATDRHVVTRQIRGDSGCHRQHGILIAHGPEIERGKKVANAHIMDLAPTILHLMELPVLASMDGKVLSDMVSGSRPVEHTAPSAPGPEAYGSLSAEEEAEVEDRLRALGYLG
jgi:hypothetical protein